MTHCCGPRSRRKPEMEFEREEARQLGAKEKSSGKFFWKKLLRSLGLRGQDKDSTGED